MANNNFEEYISKVTTAITKNHETIAYLHKEIDAKVQENKHLLESLNEAIKNQMKTLQSPTTKPQSFISKLATMPSTSNTSHISPTISSDITMSDKLKYPSEVLIAYEKIMKFYDYKKNMNILRSLKLSKYPRYLCSELANPDVVEKLFTYGFIDKIMVDETLYSISKLPSLMVESVKAMIASYGNGTYGIQIFDVSTDLTGKPIVICQLFRMGKKEIQGDYANLTLPPPCTLANFQDWLCMKRAIGLSTLKGKIDDMIRAGKAKVLGTSKGGAVEEIITIYYDNETISRDTMELERLRDRIVRLQHTHAKQTIKHFHVISGQKKRHVLSTVSSINNTNVTIKEEGSPDPFK